MMTRPYLAAIALSSSLLLAGCGLGAGGNGGGSSPVGSRASLTGMVHGGQQPVAGSTIQLYAVGNTGLKSASTRLIAQTVLTSGDGHFTITGLWNCNDTATYGSDPLLYITATGGNPGLAPGTNNSALAMMVALGPCSTINASTFISINELTSAASIYALAPFMADKDHIGAAAIRMAALRSAFASVSTLVNTTSGAAPGQGMVAGETVPVATLNTIADIIAACVNTDGTGVCGTLFGATTPSGGVAPADTIASTLQMALAPASNTSTLFNLLVPGSPFQPVLASIPNDFSLAVNFTGGGLSGPAGLAVDADGNVWVANASGASITGLSNQGAQLTGATGFTANGSIFGAQAIAVDTTGNVWVADTLTSKLFKLTVSGGAVLSSAVFTDGLAGPTALAIDRQNHVWVANNADGTIAEFDSSGAVMGGGAFNPGGVMQAPLGIAIDGSGNAWATDNQTSLVVKFDSNRNLLSGSGYGDGVLVAPAGLALDAGGNAFVAGTGSAGLSIFASNGVATGFVKVAAPVAVAINGAGTAWVTSSAGNLTQVVKGAAVSLGSLSSPLGVAIDASGNVWTANAGNDSVSKFVGVAAVSGP